MRRATWHHQNVNKAEGTFVLVSETKVEKEIAAKKLVFILHWVSLNALLQVDA